MAAMLVLPDAAYKDSFADALTEGMNATPATQDEINWVREDFADWLRASRDMTRRIVLPDGTQVPRVPDTDYWLVEGKRFIGRATLRHHINAHLEIDGGHIGYAVRKSERGKGYGKQILLHCLPKAAGLGIEKVLLTCAEDNMHSVRIIEYAGGILQDIITPPWGGHRMRRYWINTQQQEGISS